MKPASPQPDLSKNFKETDKGTLHEDWQNLQEEQELDNLIQKAWDNYQEEIAFFEDFEASLDEGALTEDEVESAVEAPVPSFNPYHWDSRAQNHPANDIMNRPIDPEVVAQLRADEEAGKISFEEYILQKLFLQAETDHDLEQLINFFEEEAELFSQKLKRGKEAKDILKSYYGLPE